MPYEAYEYSAFISYHQPDSKIPGRQWAQWIQLLLENFPTTPELAGKRSRYGDPVPHSMPRVFRDKSEVAAGGDLPTVIAEALRQSRVLVVLCSPGAAASEWVAKEVIEFKKLGRLDPIVAVLLAGEPPECYPEPLRYHLLPDGTVDRSRKAEPVWVDFRGPAGTVGATSPEAYRTQLVQEGRLSPTYIQECVLNYTVQFENARIMLLAGVLGLSHRDVDDVDKFRQAEAVRLATLQAAANRTASRRRATLAVVTTAALLMLASATALLYQKAHRAETNLALSLGNAAMPSQLSQPAVAQTPPPPATPTSLVTSDDEADAVRRWDELCNQATVAYLAGQNVQSLPIWQAAIDHCKAQLLLDPGSETWQFNLSQGYHRLGESLSQQSGQLPAAVTAFQQGLSALRPIYESAPTNVQWIRARAMLLLQLGTSQLADGHVDSALTSLTESVGLTRQLFDKDNTTYACDLARSIRARALANYIRATTPPSIAKPDLANAYYALAAEGWQESQTLLATVPATDPSYTVVPQFLDYDNQLLALCQIALHHPDAALETRRSNLQVVTGMLSASPANSILKVNLSRVQGHLAESILSIPSADQRKATELIDEAQRRLEEIGDQPEVSGGADYQGVKVYLETLRAQLPRID